MGEQMELGLFIIEEELDVEQCPLCGETVYVGMLTRHIDKDHEQYDPYYL